MNKEQLLAIIQSGHHTDGDLADAILSKLSEQNPVCYAFKNYGQWSVVAEDVTDPKVIPLYLHPEPSVPKGFTAIHLKTGNEYQVIGEAIDATNMHCNQLMVIYQRDGKTFVREAEEFQEKFKAWRSMK